MTVDYSRRGRAAKRKGDSFELEVRDVLRAHGYTGAHRNFQSGGQGGGDLADAIPDVHIEAKRHERVALPQWWRQACADARPTDSVWVVHRGNQQPLMVTLLLTDLVPLNPSQLAPRVVGAAVSVRSEFMQAFKARSSSSRPAVVHPVAGFAMVTVLLEDLLGWWYS